MVVCETPDNATERSVAAWQEGRPELSERETLTVAEAAEQIGVSRNFAYAMIHDGEIPHLRLGRRIVVPKSALKNWLATAGTASSREATS